MGTIRWAGTVWAMWLAVSASGASATASGEERPYFTNVTIADGMVRGSLVNTTKRTLATWTIDLVDNGGRPITSLTTDASGNPFGLLKPRATFPVEVGPGASPQVAALVFRAAIDTDGQPLGAPEDVAKLVAAQARRRALEADRIAPRK
jgi:hypothetical protein